MRTILFISHSASLTGAPAMLLLIVKHIDKKKFRPIVVLGEDGPLKSEFEQHAETIVQPLYPESVKYVREFSLASKRLDLLKRLKPDLVYCNTVRSAKWLLYAKWLGLPTILHVHELQDVFRDLSFLDITIIKRFADKYIAVSNAVKEHLVQAVGISAEKIELLYESVETRNVTRKRNEALRASLFPDGADIIVGTVGRVSAFKGTDLFVNAAHEILRSGGIEKKRIKALIVGGPTESDRGFYSQLQGKIREYGLEKEIVITGVQRDVIPYFSLIDIFVLASPNDPFPLVNLEAMSLGIPVVAFDAGGNREALDNCGVLVKEMTAQALSQAVINLMNNPEERTRLGTAGQTRVRELFDIEKNIGKLEQILSK